MDDTTDQECQPEILSLADFHVTIPQDVYDLLSKQYSSLDNSNDVDGNETKHIDRILNCMKKSPVDTCCRVNQINSTVHEVKAGLQQYFAGKSTESHHHYNRCSFSLQQHDTLMDLVTIRTTDNNISNSHDNDMNLYESNVPPISKSNTKNDKQLLFANWHLRHKQGWPLTHRCIIVDRFCAEAVLRGADIFVKGILCADAGIIEGEEVAVYASLPHSRHSKGNTNTSSSAKSNPITRGMLLQNYCDRCVFIGIGVSQCKRADYFASSSGTGVVMTSIAGTQQPSMYGVLEGKMILQNLPSVVVAHALDPKPGEVILDMCCAPGGKTTHLASLMNDNGLIIACDKSRKKMISARDFFQRNGASCIVPLALDSTKALLPLLPNDDEWKSPKQIIDSALVTSDGLKNVKGFYPNSFDRILLDPPCSALGLRPKLHIDIKSAKELLKAAEYQQKFIRNAIPLLKVGGRMTYSTCTINTYENEEMVKFILDEFSCMRLESLSNNLPGLPGLLDKGLTVEQCSFVRRFDPTDSLDTMGFFVAKFRKVTDLI